MSKANAKQAPRRLGKGLSAIIKQRETPAARVANPVAPPPEAEQASHQPLTLRIDQIRSSSVNPRKNFDAESLDALAASIRQHGVMQPVVVRRVAADAYELIAGERRWRAATLAGLDRLPAVIRDCSDSEAFELALIENLQREDLNPLERAQGYQHYLDELGTTVELLAERLAESRANIANYLRLLKLPNEIQQFVSIGELSMGQARAIAGIATPEQQLSIARLAIRRNLSVRQVEALAAEARGREAVAIASVPDIEQTAADQHLADVTRQLSKALGIKVVVQPGRKKNSGRIVLHYRNLDDFDRVAEQLRAEMDSL